MDENEVKEVNKKFNDLQKYIPFLEKFAAFIEQTGNPGITEKQKKCNQLLGLLKAGCKKSTQIGLLINIEKVIKTLMEQSGERFIQSHLMKQERSDRASGMANHLSPDRRPSSRERLNESSRASREYRGSGRSYYHESKQRSTTHETQNNWKDEYRNRSERSRNDHKNRVDSRKNEWNRRERSRERDFCRKMNKRESLSPHDRHGRRNDHQAHKHSTSPSPSRHFSSQKKITQSHFSVFRRLEPPLNFNTPSTSKTTVSPSTRFEQRPQKTLIKTEVSPTGNKIQEEALSELDQSLKSFFGMSKDNETLVEQMNKFKDIENMAADVKNRCEKNYHNSLLNDLQSTGIYVRKDSLPSDVPILYSKSPEFYSPKTSNINQKENSSTPHSERITLYTDNSIRDVQSRTESNGSILDQSPNTSSSTQTHQQQDPRLRSRESNMIETLEPRRLCEQFGPREHSEARSIQPSNPFRNSNKFDVMRNSQAAVVDKQSNNLRNFDRPAVPANFLKSHRDNSQITTNTPIPPYSRPSDNNYVTSPVIRKANITYGDYKRRSQLERSQSVNIGVPTTSTSIVSSSTSSTQNKNPTEVIGIVINQDPPPTGRKRVEENVHPAKSRMNSSGHSPDKEVRSKNSDKSSVTNKTKFRIPKINKANSSNESRPMSDLDESSEKRIENRKEKNVNRTNDLSSKDDAKKKQTETSNNEPKIQENIPVSADTTFNTNSVGLNDEYTRDQSTDHDPSITTSIKEALLSLQTNLDKGKYEQIIKVITDVKGNDSNDNAVSSSTSKRDSTGSHEKSEPESSKDHKTPRKKKNELDRLNEDILANYTDVLKATGRRACTVNPRKEIIYDEDLSHSKPTKSTAKNTSKSFGSGDESDEIGKPRARIVRRRNTKHDERLNDVVSDDSSLDGDVLSAGKHTSNDNEYNFGSKNMEHSESRKRPGPKSANSKYTKKIRSADELRSMGLNDCKVILRPLDDALMDRYVRKNCENVENDVISKKVEKFIKNIDKKMTARDAKMCIFCRKPYANLAYHFFNMHSSEEVYCARMSIDYSHRARSEPPQVAKYCNSNARVHCFYCEKDIKNSTGRLIDHFVRHTGEYNKQCAQCGEITNVSNGKTNCKHSDSRNVNKVQFYGSIYVYMCNHCNYTQIQEENLKGHIRRMHDIKTNIISQYKKVILVTNLKSKKQPVQPNSESEAVSEPLNQDVFKPTLHDDDLFNSNSMRLIKENSFSDTANTNTKPKNVRSMADTLNERFKQQKENESIKMEFEDAVSIAFRGPNETSENGSHGNEIPNEPNFLARGEAVEAMFKFETSKEELNSSTISKHNNNLSDDEEEGDDQNWESCSTGSESDKFSSNNIFNDKIKRFSSVFGKSKVNKSKLKTKKRSDRTSLTAATNKSETIDDVIDLDDDDYEIIPEASTSRENEISSEVRPMKNNENRIENIAYFEFDDQHKYLCYIGNCDFISLNNVSAFSNHLRKHGMDKSMAWTGVCHTCDKQIHNGTYSLMKEYNHMMAVHLPEENKKIKPILPKIPMVSTVVENIPIELIAEKLVVETPVIAQPKPLLRVRRLSGDILSGANSKQPDLVISDVTSLSEPFSSIKNLDSLQPCEEPMEVDTVSENPLKPWTKCSNTKSQDAVIKLKRQVSLAALFKCMAIDCIFTTSCHEIMLKHLSNHEDFLIQQAAIATIHLHQDTSSWLECCYCDEILGSCALLVKHIEIEHASSIFQCTLCFYRSVDPENVSSHIEKYHSAQLRMVLICGSEPKGLSDEIDWLVSAAKNLQQINCTLPDCNMSFIHMNDFDGHLNQYHADKQYFHCPFCPMRLFKLKDHGIDMTHFEEHGISLCHCAYCPFRSSDAIKMKNHLRDEHPTRLAYALLRINNETTNSTDQASIVRAHESDKDSILCHPTFTIEQINFMNPSLSEHATNCVEVPNSADNSMCSDSDFKHNRQLKRQKSEHLLKKYKICAIEKLITEKVATTSFGSLIDSEKLPVVSITDNDTICISDSPELACTIDSIQNEIDSAARTLLSEKGVNIKNLYCCGFDGCTWLKSNAKEAEFLMHLSQHRFGMFPCYHCGEEYERPTYLKDHIKKSHAAHRYFCYCCNNTESNYQSMVEHFKNIHKNDLVHYFPLNPSRNDLNQDIFVVCPLTISSIKDFGVKLIEHRKDRMLTKKCYLPEEVHLLPTCHVFTEDVQCKKCGFKTKVRSNMKRHLMSKDCTESPEISIENGPVNPVPHLSKGEKYSDRMKNLAASSNVPDTAIIEQFDSDPTLKYIPEGELYVCGALSCHYATQTSDMLRCHMVTLHQLDNEFYCPHCRTELAKGKPINASEILNHLRFHDAKLFKCPSCPYTHFMKNSVEKHICDVHTHIKDRIVQTIDRSSKKMEVIKPMSKSTIHKWKCNICVKTLFNTKSLVKQHLSKTHQIECQYQCGQCTFQDDTKARIKEHLSITHKDNPKIQVKVFFEQIECDVDNSPIWRRDDPTRIKHIRGILFDDEDQLNNDIHSTRIIKSTTSTLNKKQIQINPEHSARTDQQLFASPINRDRFVILPPKASGDDLTIDRPRPASLRQMPKRRFSTYIPSSIDTQPSTSNAQPSISIRLKRVSDPITDAKIMPPPSKLFKTSIIRKEQDKPSLLPLVYLCNYCSHSTSTFEDIHAHWSQTHEKACSKNQEESFFSYQITMKVKCIYCDEKVTFHSVRDHVLIKTHSTKSYAFAKYSDVQSDTLTCGICSTKVVNETDLVKHFRCEHQSSLQTDLKIQPMQEMNDQIVEDLLNQGSQETFECVYCNKLFICRFDYKKHHEHEHPSTYELSVKKDLRAIKYNCFDCRHYSSDITEIVAHIRQKHSQTWYQCLFCTKMVQYKKLIKTHNELIHKSTVLDYRILDARENLTPYYKMTMTFPNGLIFNWADVMNTKYGRIEDVVNYVNMLNEVERQEFIGSSASSESMINPPGKIGARRRQTHLF